MTLTPTEPILILSDLHLGHRHRAQGLELGGQAAAEGARRDGCRDRPARRPVDYENALGEWPEKHILGTQLGPNENGHPWPPHRKRERVTW